MARKPGTPWLDPDRRYRLSLTVGALGYARQESPVEVELDFAGLLARLGASGAFAPESLRVVEIGAGGAALDGAVPFQLDATEPAGPETLVFLLQGQTAPDAVRHFHVYFDLAGRPWHAPHFPPQVTVTDGVMHEGQESYRIATPSATYLYHKEGAGFASLFDREGNDWISYHPQGGSAGHYRGIPNLGQCGHPGYTNSTSRLVSQGPLRARLLSQGKEGGWAFTWGIYPHFARLTLLEMAGPYWFLYEGTPGGRLDEAHDYLVRAPGVRTPASEIWDEHIPDPAWIYFGSGRVSRVLYLVRHETHSVPDQYWPMEHNMTVFGFGRRYRTTERFMTRVPAHFTIGLAEDGALEAARTTIDSAWRDLAVTVGEPESRPA